MDEFSALFVYISVPVLRNSGVAKSMESSKWKSNRQADKVKVFNKRIPARWPVAKAPGRLRCLNLIKTGSGERPAECFDALSTRRDESNGFHCR
ncbi:hypothetical protein AVEN_167244-1 [Araneus ventricosus]|uniref:Uncharacterized protein n=1 Tax=Araneus ventricosus TaxID=182803 RepID=A0A4Y2QAM6_ARAVE|nr:hypothetical protein AVEN_206689-1 [Araneus ventricosus]GBN57476.1 hypothetical protein AVEN_214905-1 [Araneus ventricosus]GBN59950.1 hypothetical protein AVEN_121576-1 [Araneus ventricosus]GBN60035.1 hypothetical protein AVEN_167244-1 [Araneus ventricosus]